MSGGAFPAPRRPLSWMGHRGSYRNDDERLSVLVCQHCGCLVSYDHLDRHEKRCPRDLLVIEHNCDGLEEDDE